MQDLRSTITSIVSTNSDARANQETGLGCQYLNAPLSSISKDAGVSSSPIRAPSYRNLNRTPLAIRHANKRRCARPGARSSIDLQPRRPGRPAPPLSDIHSPNAADIFPHFARVRALQLAQFCVALDLEKHLLARGRDDLRARTPRQPAVLRKKTRVNRGRNAQTLMLMVFGSPSALTSSWVGGGGA